MQPFCVALPTFSANKKSTLSGAFNDYPSVKTYGFDTSPDKGRQAGHIPLSLYFRLSKKSCRMMVAATVSTTCLRFLPRTSF